ncbi:MAG: transporter substrate-binding protein [Ilumatobacteraceae bacterium]|nr:transporter substrate-binding protein [Ilumatobacteraceae bacterium]
MNRFRTGVVVVVVLGLSVAAAGCGSDKKQSSSATSAASTGSPAATTTAAATTQAASSSTAAGGSGSAGSSASTGPVTPASGAPILIGFTNMEGGAISLPEIRIGAEQGMNYVNEQMGGVQGRPLKLMRCDVDGSPEKSVDCGNKFVEAKVSAVMEGVDVGADAMLPILRDAKIPLFGFVPYGPQQRSATDIAVFLGTAVPAYGAAELKNSADQGRKKLRLFLADLPSSHSYDETVIQPTAKTLGLDVKIIFYDAASADWNALATTAMADKPDETGSPSAQEADCLGFIQGLRGAGFTGPIFAAACNQFIATVGTQAVGVQTYSEYWLPSVPDAAPPVAQAELKTYIDQMTSSGNKDLINGFAGFTFAAAVNFGRAMQKYLQGDPNGVNILTALHSVKDMPGFLHGNLTCDGSVWKGETSCTAGVLIYEVIPGGGRKLVSKGFIDASVFAPK